jgi:hypothetical protein
MAYGVTKRLARVISPTTATCEFEITQLKINILLIRYCNRYNNFNGLSFCKAASQTEAIGYFEAIANCEMNEFHTKSRVIITALMLIIILPPSFDFLKLLNGIIQAH